MQAVLLVVCGDYKRGLSDRSDLSDESDILPHTPVAGKISLQTSVRGNAKTVSIGFCPHTHIARRSKPSRAGGERDFLFASQKENRVHPSIAAASEAFAATLRRTLNAGRRYLKKAPMRQIFFTDAAKEARGKAQGRFPAGRAASAPICNQQLPYAQG